MAAGVPLRLVKPEAFRDAARTAGIAALLALPLLGFRAVESAHGIDLAHRFSFVAYAALAVFFGRLGLSYCGVGPAFSEGGSVAAAVPRTKPYVPYARLLQVSMNLLAILFALGLPWFSFADADFIDRAILILIYVMLGIGLNIVVGLAGLLDLGFAAFYAVGAYTYALLSRHFALSFWECLPISALLAASFGLALASPVSRLRSEYLAIATLGFGAMVQVVLVNWTEIMGGPSGLPGIPPPSFFGLPFAASAPAGEKTFAQYFSLPFSPMHRVYFLYYLILAMVLLAAAFVWRIRRLPLGRAWEALRDDEIACRSLGLNPVTIKLSALALSAAVAGFAGCFFAAWQGYVSPDRFTFSETAIILAIVVLGGSKNQLGLALAAILVVGIPEWFPTLVEYRMVALGAALVLAMLWGQRGVSARRAPTIRLKRQTVPQMAKAEIK